MILFGLPTEKNNRGKLSKNTGKLGIFDNTLGLDKYADFLYVPYRPISGNLAKDLKNTFLFTVDSLQVTETSFKQFHPDIYPRCSSGVYIESGI